MATKIYWIAQLDNLAKLGIMPRPRGNDWLGDEVGNFKKQKVGLIVSLLEKDEIVELGLTNEEVICSEHNIHFINYPIPDRDIPKSGEKTDAFIADLKSELDSGTNVVIHCRMGIGRSSIIAAAILLESGTKADDIIKEISKIRGFQVPDTEEQVNWLRARQ